MDTKDEKPWDCCVTDSEHRALMGLIQDGYFSDRYTKADSTFLDDQKKAKKAKEYLLKLEVVDDLDFDNDRHDRMRFFDDIGLE